MHRLSDYSSKWHPAYFDHENSRESYAIIRKQWIQVSKGRSNVNAFELQISERECEGGTKVAKSLKINIGIIDIEYNNDILKNMCELLGEYKDNHAFRYRTLDSIINVGFS